MKCFIPALVVLALAGSTRAHIEMTNPPPLRSKYNPYARESEIDYDMVSPITDLADFPCKGYLGDPMKSVAKYSAGETYTLELSGSATHMGGSCQLSLSYDKGKTFKVIKNIIGSCPINMEYNFTIPDDAPSGNALFSWSWMNHMGNREFYQNCAWITIKSSSNNRILDTPDMFVGNLPGYCTVPEGYDFVYPHTGPVTEWGGDPAYYTDECADGTNETSANGTLSISGKANSDAESDESFIETLANASSTVGSKSSKKKEPSAPVTSSLEVAPPQSTLREVYRVSQNGSHSQHRHGRPQVSELSTPHPTIDVAGGTIVRPPCSK
ncbi:hypothetical protein TRVA0_008S02300 [Trichomonascus vanleenenianus]|uniref:uncharacterized protein n=1 Tax=Trichomonascus vanleenenianus TaxID=2268995 RepID=UPI003ECA09E4